MKEKLKMGLTGGYGTGKSTVLAEFKRLGADTISADEIAREVVKPGHKGWKLVAAAFGAGILKKNKSINRKKLGDIVFNDPSKRILLEKITHPLIIDSITKRIKASKGPVVVEAPLLFEARMARVFDVIITVTADFKNVSKRLGEPASAIKARTGSQMPLSRKAALSDFTIDNSGPLSATRRAVKTIWDRLTK